MLTLHSAVHHMKGSLALTLALVDGRTRPTHLLAVPPLQCSRARYDHPQSPAMTSLTLLHLGGVLQGDHLELNVALESGAAAHLSTAAATQVYRMPERDASQTTCITLHPRATLLYLPEPTILFAEARFTQNTRITLHQDATLVVREIFVGGRLARGEQHQYERYCSQFEVYNSEEKCLLAERALIEPLRFSPATHGVQGRYPVVGSLYLLALNGDREAWLARAWDVLRAHPAVLAGAGALPNNCGVLVRVVGTTSHIVRAALDAVLQNTCI